MFQRKSNYLHEFKNPNKVENRNPKNREAKSKKRKKRNPKEKIIKDTRGIKATSNYRATQSKFLQKIDFWRHAPFQMSFHTHIQSTKKE